MDRRRFLVAVGAAAGLTGCMGGSSDGTPSDAGPGSGGTDSGTPEPVSAENDGYPDPSGIDETPPAPDADTSSFRTITYEQGIEVPLVPIDVAYDWYRRRDARFADARGERQYATSHITGAVLSPASGRRDDPAAAWPQSDRIVTYCGCPHHLSSMRAAQLYQNGYEEVYAIDEGFWEWHRLDYPMTGENVEYQPYGFLIEGAADPATAGEYAWARTADGSQEEAHPIGSDGSYELVLHFSDVTDGTQITVETPSYSLTEPLGELTSGVVTREGTVAGGTRA
ncbi:rhodanese-like domain-containing protein [Halorientalis regularis]|jgi:rhodanese-related sulfurtransferase|uniref:Rhodanese-related sulfurtransferase n=1 Tax=Halorientalis regularis TaxID=660518 RepID=A0A1G7GFV6_9EURY|nr:rhodanese-like domain-containing protein [Halorientalis regularis]SDE87010.1 Rhodanese-related sulfurtransferase [Halorientalis regularis]